MDFLNGLIHDKGKILMKLNFLCLVSWPKIYRLFFLPDRVFYYLYLEWDHMTY
jgi:hypothetical protein